MGTIHVLIADDSLDFRRSLRRHLDRKEGLEVVGEAADGRAAVELAGADRPEVVLMDVEMPVLDGIEATREIHDRWPEVQVVALTIYDRPVYREAMAEAGACGYVVKDGGMGELVGTLRDTQQDQLAEPRARPRPRPLKHRSGKSNKSTKGSLYCQKF